MKETKVVRIYFDVVSYIVRFQRKNGKKEFKICTPFQFRALNSVYWKVVSLYCNYMELTPTGEIVGGGTEKIIFRDYQEAEIKFYTVYLIAQKPNRAGLPDVWDGSGVTDFTFGVSKKKWNEARKAVLAWLQERNRKLLEGASDVRLKIATSDVVKSHNFTIRKRKDGFFTLAYRTVTMEAGVKKVKSYFYDYLMFGAVGDYIYNLAPNHDICNSVQASVCRGFRRTFEDGDNTSWRFAEG